MTRTRDTSPPHRPGRLAIVLGDQLDRQSPAIRGLDPARDRVWMAEVEAESTHVPSHKARIALFLSAMRHFRDELRAGGLQVEYLELGTHAHATLGAALAAELQRRPPTQVLLVKPGEYRVERELCAAVADRGIALQLLEDPHFFTTPAEFATWAEGRRELRLEYFYRLQRRRSGLLMEGEEPAGGRWNFDAENRGRFSAEGPPAGLREPLAFAPDSCTQEVMRLVAQRFATHPGELGQFDWPVTPDQAEAALADFLEWRLPQFGRYQDAMWTGRGYLYHSRLAAAMNLKLISPRTVCRAVESAWRQGQVPLAAAEGFIRQVLGWREYVRGLYWLKMPEYLEMNALEAAEPLPDCYWTGETSMACMREVLGQTLATGYAHHIQRLMVTGLFALLWGARPREVHEWYLSVYVDAVEWVELPNTLGMAQHADGGIMASKPYAASGKYIDRMSNYCSGCRFDPGKSTGADACPFTTLYWDFLDRHRARFERHPRMALQVRNLAGMSTTELQAVRRQAQALHRDGPP